MITTIVIIYNNAFAKVIVFAPRVLQQEYSLLVIQMSTKFLVINITALAINLLEKIFQNIEQFIHLIHEVTRRKL